MAEDKATLREVDYRSVFPWLALFRSFGIAIDPKKLVLAAAGVIAMTAGWYLLANLFLNFSTNPIVLEQANALRSWPWEEREMAPHVGKQEGLGVLDALLADPLNTLRELATDWPFMFHPVMEFVRPFKVMFRREAGFVSVVFSLVAGMWAVAVWALFGGAITRIAAVQFAREEKIGLMESLRFSASKFLSYFGAPLIPAGFIAFLAGLCLIGGLITNIPGFGPVFAGALWFLPLIAGSVMAIILVAWAVGWPLMYSTVSVEGSDSFDALSRSWAYAFQRPWHYLFYALVALVFGSLCSAFVRVFAHLVVYMAAWAVSWGGGSGLRETLDQLAYYAPLASGWGSPSGRQLGGTAPEGAAWFGSICAAVWLYALFFLLVGFVYSYFWSASTVIYYLLRRAVDNTELQEVYLEGEDDDFAAIDGGSTAAGGSTAGGQPGGAPPATASPAGETSKP